MMNKEQMIKLCEIYEEKYGENNWCLTNFPESSNTKLIVRDLRGYAPTLNVSDAVQEAVNSHYGIDIEEHDAILLSTMQY